MNQVKQDGVETDPCHSRHHLEIISDYVRNRTVELFKAHSHLLSAFGFFIDLCHPVLKHANVEVLTPSIAVKGPILDA